MRVALRTQQVIAHETGVTNTVDPLGGSYFVEALTDEMERAAYEYFARIDELGGMVEAIKRGFPQREIADASFRYQQEVDSRRADRGRRQRVPPRGRGGARDPPPRPGVERKQAGRLSATRAGRDSGAVEPALAALKRAAATEGENLMPLLPRRRARPRLGGRDGRRAPGGLRHLHRAARSSERRPGRAPPGCYAHWRS